MSEEESGERLFARYAHTPNALGYCGPAEAGVLQRAACGLPFAAEDLRRVARGFSGAWPYQQMIGELAGLDPLGPEVGRAYWTGSALTDAIDVRRLGEMLLERFGSQAGHYWAHLTPDLLAEVTPTHIFHVLGVYPWTRLLATGAPEPLTVLDGCRIRVGRVTGVGARLTVATDRLVYDADGLSLADSDAEEVDFEVPDGTFLGGDVAEGDLVAIHWGFACDRLDPDEATRLRELTARQLALTNRRLSG